MENRFAADQKTEFDELIKLHANKSLVKEIFSAKKKIYSWDLFEACISEPIIALRLIVDLSVSSRVNVIAKLLRTELGHRIANQPFEKTQHGILDEYENKQLSELIATTIVNHSLVRYYLTQNKEHYDIVKKYLLPGELKVIEELRPEFSDEMNAQESLQTKPSRNKGQ